MRPISMALVSLVCAALASPAWAHKDKDHRLEHGGPRVERGVAPAPGAAVPSHYSSAFASANCPPGLAKKHNGCMPPGQAKKIWPMSYAPVVPAHYPPRGLTINIPLR